MHRVGYSYNSYNLSSYQIGQTGTDYRTLPTRNSANLLSMRLWGGWGKKQLKNYTEKDRLSPETYPVLHVTWSLVKAMDVILISFKLSINFLSCHFGIHFPWSCQNAANIHVQYVECLIATDKRGYPHNIFLISRRKHTLWVLIRSTSARDF